MGPYADIYIHTYISVKSEQITEFDFYFKSIFRNEGEQRKDINT